MIERVFHCDRRDCEHHARTLKTRPPVFLTVTGDGKPLHFCGWDCLLKHAAEFPPAEVVE
jgi:hypothetical protein